MIQGVFECPGSITEYDYTEDYSNGKGANHVVATSSGEGDVRPQSAPARDEAALAAGWPRYEYRYSPSTSIKEVDTLNAHARSALALLRLGSRTLTMTARTSVAPVLGVEWNQGDDIEADVTSDRHPDGFTLVGRAVGYQLDPKADTVTPILLEKDVEGS